MDPRTVQTLLLQRDYLDDVQNSSDPVFHYTSPNGLLSIIKNKSFRFGDFRFFNDINELEYARKLIIECLNELRKISNHTFYDILESEFNEPTCYSNREEIFIYYKNLDLSELEKNNLKLFPKSKYKTFVLCCSLDKDNMEMWNYYTKNNFGLGYNIQIDKQEFINQFTSLKCFKNNDSVLKVHYLFSGKIIYDQFKQKEIIKRAINKFRLVWHDIDKIEVMKEFKIDSLKQIVFLFDIFSILMKAPYFENEHEFRFTFWLPEDCDNLKYMNTIDNNFQLEIINGSFAPKIDIKVDDIHKIITQINIGPYNNQDFTELGLKELLKHFGFNDLLTKKNAIMKSDILVRY